MKSKIVIFVIIGLLIGSAVGQGILIDDITGELWQTRSELRTTKADLDELGAYTFAMAACDMELMLNLDLRKNTGDTISRLEIVSSAALHRGDYEIYNEYQTHISEWQEQMNELEAEWGELVAYKTDLLRIMEDKWEM